MPYQALSPVFQVRRAKSEPEDQRQARRRWGRSNEIEPITKISAHMRMSTEKPTRPLYSLDIPLFYCIIDIYQLFSQSNTRVATLTYKRSNV